MTNYLKTITSVRGGTLLFFCDVYLDHNRRTYLYIELIEKKISSVCEKHGASICINALAGMAGLPLYAEKENPFKSSFYLMINVQKIGSRVTHLTLNSPKKSFSHI